MNSSFQNIFENFASSSSSDNEIKFSTIDELLALNKEIIVKTEDNYRCNLCFCSLSARLTNMNRHLNTSKHKENKEMQRYKRSFSDDEMEFPNKRTESYNQYFYDLAKTFMACDIPLYKMDKPLLINFL